MGAGTDGGGSIGQESAKEIDQSEEIQILCTTEPSAASSTMSPN